MQITNLATVSVATTAGGSVLVTGAQMNTIVGASYVYVNPSVPIVLVDNNSVGTAANSPLVCPAGTFTEISHKQGTLKAISLNGTATVKVAIGATP